MKSLLIITVFALTSITSNAQIWVENSKNLNNPYDSVGIIHNLGLESVKNQTGVSPKNKTLGFSSNMYPEISTNSRNDIIDLGIYHAVKDSTNYSPDYMSESGKNFSSQLLSIVDQVPDSTMFAAGTQSIRNLESQILSSTNISETEKKSLLCASSVARYSLNYWAENGGTDAAQEVGYIGQKTIDNTGFDNTNYLAPIEELNYGYNRNSLPVFIGDDSDYKKGWLRRILRVVVGDVVGALVGAGLGSLTGSSAIIIAGAFFGAMSGSLAAADSEGMFD
jgi:hypothetical protein